MSESPPPLKRKRAAQAMVSDSDGDSEFGQSAPSSSRRSTKRRSVPATPTQADSDLDILDSGDSDDDEDQLSSPAAARKKDKGKGRAVSATSSADGADVAVADSQEDMDLNGTGKAGEVDEPEEDADEEVEEVDEGIKPEYERDTDGYVKGSIVRMKLVNFMTYDHVEFRPGPHLNMILGPNGTGKSSIAAALAVGLGFHAKVMGRAPDLKSYVKQGCEESQTEVEIKGGRRGKNTILHCTFGRESDKTSWKINGEAATKKAVTQAVADFGVQANNLCCFLPQDKVAEFARLLPEGVLTETMRAAGDPRLSKWHKVLSEKGTKRTELANTVQRETADRDRLQTLVQGMTGEVESFERRRELEVERQALLGLLLHIKAGQAAAALNEAKAKRRALKRDYDTLTGYRQPIADLLAHYQDKLGDTNNAHEDAEKQREKAQKRAGKPYRDLEKMEEAVEDINRQIKQIKKKTERAHDQRKDYTKDRRAAQAILDEDDEDYKGQHKALQLDRKVPAAKMRELEQEIEDVQEKQDQVNADVSRLAREQDQLYQRHEELANIDKKREKDARLWDPSIDYALDYLEKNEARLFEAPVIRPACMSVNVKDKRLAKQLENCTSMGQRKTFICTTENDFDQLLKLSKMSYPPKGKRDGGKMQLTFMRINVDDSTLNPPRPCSQETLQGLGFEGFAIDFIQAADPMIAFLNRIGMSSTAVTHRPASQINDAAAFQAGLMQWVCEDIVSSSLRSAYGRRDIQTTTRRTLEPKSWLAGIDNAAAQQVLAQIADVKRERRALEGPVAEWQKKYTDLREDMKTHKEEYDEINRKMEKVKKKYQRREDAKRDVAKYDELLAEDRVGDLVREKEALNRQRAGNVRSRLKPVLDCFAGCEIMFQTTNPLVDAALEKTLMRDNVDTIREKVNEGKEELVQAKQLINQHERVFVDATARTKECTADIHEFLNTCDRATQRALQPRLQSDQTHDYATVQEELAAAENDLQMSEGINPDVVDKYKRYKKDLEEKETLVQEKSVKLESVREAIAAIQHQFDPALDALVRVVNEKFSQSFERVGCTGEVRLNRKSDDFAKWGIEIAVSYRDGDEMALLTASRQSGGERSLATITYLMSLTEMARTPFSLVDEINQGMDQRAERNVHNQLVQVTCGENAGQYFLITPKLLTDLEYHPRMRILNVVNGSHIPVNSGKKRKLHWADLKACIQAAKKSADAGLIAVR